MQQLINNVVKTIKNWFYNEIIYLNNYWNTGLFQPFLKNTDVEVIAQLAANTFGDENHLDYLLDYTYYDRYEREWAVIKDIKTN